MVNSGCLARYRMSVRALGTLLKITNSNINNIRYLCYKSCLSLDKLYPESINIKPFKPPESLDGKFTGYIPIKHLQITYSNSSGPGGQHVQKNETKVDIRFHVKTASWLSETTKEKLLEKYYTRINKDGFFIVRSEKTRSKIINTADALNYIREIIYKLEEPSSQPTPETQEKLRKRQEKAARIRLMEKRRKSLLKNAKLEC